MPFYQYRCEACAHEFEARQRMSEDPLTECPVCEGAIRRVVSQVGVVFKGSGFYVTDNRNGRSAAGATEGASRSEKTSEGEGAKPEAKKDGEKVKKPAKASAGDT